MIASYSSSRRSTSAYKSKIISIKSYKVVSSLDATSTLGVVPSTTDAGSGIVLTSGSGVVLEVVSWGVSSGELSVVRVSSS
jgi:hypothetical protein